MKLMGLRIKRIAIVLLILFFANLLAAYSVVLASSSFSGVGLALHGVGATDIAYNPVDGYVYLLNSNDSVSVIDGQTVIASIDLPTGSLSRLSDLEIAANGDVYISQWFFDQVIVIRNQQIIGVIRRQDDGQPGINGIKNGPIAVAANPVTGLVYVLTAWESDPSTNGVTVLDGLQVLSHVATGANPQAVAINPTTGRVYVANSGSNTITVIDGTFVIDQISVGANPIALSIDSVNHLLYVANQGENSVSIIDEVTRIELIRLYTVSNPTDIMATPDGLAYVVNREENSFTVLDGVNLSVAGTISLGQNPLAIANDPTRGLVYVANQVDGTISVIEDSLVTATVSVGAGPVSMVYNPAKDFLYVASFESGTVTLIRGLSNVGTIENLPRLAHSAIAKLPDGQLVVADLTGREFWLLNGPEVITNAKTITTPLQLEDTPARKPLYEHLQVAHQPIAVDDQGQIFIADNRNETVSIIPSGGGAAEIVWVYGQPFDLESLDGANQVYAAIGSGVTIIKKEGVITTQYLNYPALAGARALAAWPDRDRMYVVSSPAGGTASVSILDTSVTTPTISHVIPICDIPAAIALDKQRGYAYISCSGSDSVGVISDTTWLGEIPVGWFPQGVVVNPINGYAYVAASLAHRVTVLDGLTPLATITVPENPMALTMDEAGYVYVTTTVGDAVAVISGTKLLTTIPVGAYPNAVVAVENTVYVGNAHDAMVDAFQFKNLLTDPGNDWSEAMVITSGIAYAAQIQDEEDIDWYKVYLDQPGTMITVTLGGLIVDYDLAFFSPLTNMVPISSSIEALDINRVWGDGSVQALSSWVDLGRLRELPVGRGIGALSNNSFLKPEVLSDRIWEPGDYYIAVWGHNGAHAEQPYTLRIAVTLPDEPLTMVMPITPIAIPITSTNPTIETIILTNRERLEQHYGLLRTANLIGRLEMLASATSGIIIYLDEYADAVTAYTQWDSTPQNPLAANYVADVIKYKLAGLLTTAYPNTKYIVIAGDDYIAPFYRVPDPTMISNERRYLAPLISDTPMKARIRGGYILSDNFYASLHPLPWKGRELYIPEYAIGRLVETPEEMIAAVDVYLELGPITTLNTALVTGYDFVIDSAESISHTIGNAGIIVTPLIHDEWLADELRPLLLEDEQNFVSLNGHFNHWQLLASNPITYSYIAATEVSSATTTYALDLVISIGCQSGLNINDQDVTDLEIAKDFAQAFVGRGAVYIANTGFGYGDSDAIGYSELLAWKFAQELATPRDHPVSIGQALMYAKQTYYTDVGYASFGDYDEKILIEWTLYGLPMVKVESPLAAVDAAESRMQNSPEELQLPASGGGEFLTSFVTITSTFELLTSTRNINAMPTAVGNYYQVNSHVQIDDLLSEVEGDFQISPGRPLQPRVGVELRDIPGFVVHGALFSGGLYRDEPFNPVVSRIVSDTAMMEPSFPFTRWYPSLLHVVNRLFFGDYLAAQKLVIVPAQYLAQDSSTGTERLYEGLHYEAYYSPRGITSDFAPPAIKQVEVVTSALAINFSVGVTDTSGIERVVVAYDDGVGTWRIVDLSLTANGRWVGSISSSLTQFFVQAVDAFGNIAISDNKGIYFTVAGAAFTPNHVAYAKPGTEVSYLHTIVNTGGSTDTFVLSSYTSSNWLSFYNPSIVTLPPNSSATINIIVTVPAGALQGAAQTVTVTAVSLSNPNITASVVNTTIAQQIPGIALANNLTGRAMPDQIITYTHTLTNTGNGADTFHLNIDNGNLIGPAVISLPARVSTEVLLAVEVPTNVISGTRLTATLTAVSEFSPTLQATITDTTIVSRSIVLGLSSAADDTAVPGETVIFTHSVTNYGNYTDTVHFASISELDWLVSNPVSQSLAPFSADTISLSVTVPLTAVAGTVDMITFSATSASNPEVSSIVTNLILVEQVAGLSLTPNHTGYATSYHTITYTHLLTNMGNGTDSYALSVAGGILIGSPIVTLLPGASTPITMAVMIPCVISGTQITSTLTAVSQFNPTTQATVIDTTVVTQIGGVTVSPSQFGGAQPGESFAFTHAITNTGNFTDVFTISIGSELGWLVITPDPVSVAACSTADFTIIVTIPPDAIQGTTDSLTVTATSGTVPTVSATITDSLMAGQFAGVALAPSYQTAILPGEVITYTHYLTNTGNGPDTFNLVITGAELLGPNLISLSAGMSSSVQVRFTAPPCTLSGSSFSAILTATSSFDPAVSAAINNLTVINQMVGIALSPGIAADAMPGSLLTITHTLTNAGNSIDTFAIATNSNLNWPILTPTEIVVAPCTVVDFPLMVTIPDATLVSTMDVITITAVSSANSQVMAIVTDTVTVLQVAGVTLTPSYQSVAAPGEIVTYTHQLTNTGNGLDTFILAVEGGALVGPTAVTLGAGESADISTTISLPGNAISGTLFTTLLTATSTFNPDAQAVVTAATSAGRVVAMSLGTALPDSALPGAQVVFTHVLTNAGNYTDTFGLTFISPAGWVTSPPQTQPLGPGMAATVFLTVNVPLNALADTMGHIQVTAVSSANSQVMAIVTDTVTVLQVAGVTLTPSYQSVAAPGEIVTYTHQLTNTGNGLDTFILAVEGGALVGPASKVLSVGESALVTLTVMLPPTTTHGTVITVVLAAVSTHDPMVNTEVANTITITTTARQYTIYLPIVNNATSHLQSFIPGAILYHTTAQWQLTASTTMDLSSRAALSAAATPTVVAASASPQQAAHLPAAAPPARGANQPRQRPLLAAER